MSTRQFKVHKFGGSSLADAACFRRVADIIAAEPDAPMGIVVSAMGGMTDALLELAVLAEQERAFKPALDALGARYSAATADLLQGDKRAEILDEWARDAEEIRDVLSAISLVRSAPQRNRDVVAGYGELWSARLLAAYLAQQMPARAGRMIDARDVLTIATTELGPTVQWEISQERYQALGSFVADEVLVITGFIAVDEQGRPTTLGRNGSDHSASIFAALSGADALTIWTDVDGVMSADPNRVPEAQVIDRLTYNEAMELAYFGASVIHPQTLGPAIAKDIPVRIRNSLNPEHPGSCIERAAASVDGIKGITAIGGMALINLEGAGMIGVPGTAERMFAGLRQAGVSVTLISQASSEHSICIAVPEALAELAHRVISDVFADELANGQIQRIDVSEAQSILAVVGDGMAGTPGIASRFFGTLGRAGVNVRAIAQGSSERNISAVVDSADSTRALRAVHSGFYLSHKTLSIGLVGTGVVGGALLRQIGAQASKLADRFNIDLRIRGIARSQSMLLAERSIDIGKWQEDFADNSVDVDLAAFETHINPDHLPHAVIIDCTASEHIASHYAGWLQRGIHVITPNKKGFSGAYSDYRALQAAADRGSAHYFYETTVGAALPIISTLCDLIYTGDEIRAIRGIFSGTLAYLFNVYDGSRSFSDIVLEAKENGYTEPDPRDDLSGMDVARKLTILARELGIGLEIGDFPVESLVPDALQNCPLDEFMRRLPEFDAAMAARLERANSVHRQLRYVASLDADGKAAVSLEAVPEDHAFCGINLTDNIVEFESARYSANPLVIQGPGAGPEVTAGGVFSDLLRLASYLSTGQGHV